MKILSTTKETSEVFKENPLNYIDCHIVAPTRTNSNAFDIHINEAISRFNFVDYKETHRLLDNIVCTPKKIVLGSDSMMDHGNVIQSRSRSVQVYPSPASFPSCNSSPYKGRRMTEPFEVLPEPELYSGRYSSTETVVITPNITPTAMTTWSCALCQQTFENEDVLLAHVQHSKIHQIAVLEVERNKRDKEVIQLALNAILKQRSKKLESSSVGGSPLKCYRTTEDFQK